MAKTFRRLCWKVFACGVVRRCPTLPHPRECSTMGAVGLSFRVRDGSGRFPHAMAAVTLFHRPASCGGVGGVKCFGVACM